MNAAFFHDHIFTRGPDGRYASNGGLPYRVLRRYLGAFDRLVVVGRVQDGDPAAGGARASPADGEGVEMACVEGASRLDLLAGRRVARHVREVLARTDCAIVRLPSLIGIQACREATRLGKPWLAEVVGCAWEALWHHGSVGGKVMAPAFALLTRRWVARAPFAIYVSERFLQARYPTRGRWVACSNVAIGPPDPAVLAARLARIEAEPAPRPLRLGLVGSLDTDYKGHGTALRALARLRAEGLDATLACLGVGSPDRWAALAASLGVADRVRFDGLLPAGAPVLAWMDGLDALVAPSLAEGLPRSLVEAMSRALPAVGAATGGIPELLDPALLHRRGDDAGLARLVAGLAASPDRRAGAARRNFARAADFTAEVLEARRAGQLAAFRDWAAGGAR